MSALQSTSSVERYIGLLLFAETASLLSLIFRVKSHRLMKFSNCASRSYLVLDSSRIVDIESPIRTFGELASPKLISSLLLPLASRLSCQRPAPPLGLTGSGNNPTGSDRPVRVCRDGTPLAVPGESVQGNCPRGYSL